jgi:rod shape-determining protein MreB
MHDAQQKPMVTLPAAGKPTAFDVTEPLREACKKITRSIVEGIQELVARFDPEFQHRLLGNIVLCGGGNQLKGLDSLIEDELKPYGGGQAVRVGDAVFAGAFGALRLAMSIPSEHWQRMKTMDYRRVAA